MDASTPGTAKHPAARHPARWHKVLAVLALVLLALVLLAVFFPWDLLRGPLNRYVSERTGRHFEITRRLDVKLGRDTRILADGIVFANPSWSKEPNLVQAERAEVTLRLWPLIRHRQVDLPRVFLQKPHLGLEMLPDGRRTWSLEREGQGGGSELKIGAMQVDQGSVRFISPQQGADIRADFAMNAKADAQADAMPLSFRGQGTWRGQPFAAQGRTGSVLALRESQGHPFPADVEARAGNTSLRASGRVGNLARFDGANLDVDLRGRNLADLYRITGIVLPATPTYAVKGHVRREGERFQVTGLQGTLGRTDLAGELSYDTSQEVPRLVGEVRSRLLDFDDLAPLVGLAPPREDPNKQAKTKERRKGGKVLPDTPLDVSRLTRMDADVRYAAQKVVNVRQLPLERIATHVKLQGGTLDLQPLELGVGGGKLAGQVHIASQAKPAPQMRIALDARGLQLEKLFPGVPLNRASIGQVNGRIDLAGQGRSIAQILGGSSGELSLLLGRGRMSNLLLEVAGLDAGEIIKFLAGHDQVVTVRCGAAAFDVKQGIMNSRVFVLDTVDTVVYGEGSINLANETLGLTFKPYPKDKSILSFRSPLKLTGTLGAPEAGVDKGRLAGRAAVALALGAINPLLGLASTVETGPGKDADCTQVLKEAAQPRTPATPSNGGKARAASAR